MPLRRGSAAALLALAVLGPAMWPARPAAAGSNGTAFTDFDPGPRAMAMGGAGVAAAADPSAVWWNPAGLYFLRGTRATLTYDDLYGVGLVRRNYAALSIKKVITEPEFRDDRMYLHRDFERGGAWGFGLTSLSVDLDSDSYSELAPTVAYAGGLEDALSLGVALSYLRASSTVDKASANGYSLSLGLDVLPIGPTRVGVMVRNLYSRLFRTGSVQERLPVSPTVGVALPVRDRGQIVADVTWTEGNTGPSRIGAGAEYWVIPQHFAARAGLRHYGAGLQTRTVPTFGGGIRWSRFDVEYALTSDGSGPGSTHRFGLGVLLSRPQ